MIKRSLERRKGGSIMIHAKIVAADKVRYRKPISVISEKLKQFNIKPETDIRIYTDYPFGWHATVGANDRIYIFTSVFGKVVLSIEPVFGFRSNGSLIRKGESNNDR